MKPESMDAIFQALAHAGRRRIMDIVKNEPGCTVGRVCAAFEDDVSRIAVLKHLKVLEEANLLTSRKEGRSRLLYLNAVPIQVIYERWMTDYSTLWASGLTRLKYQIEGAAEATESDSPKPKRSRRTKVASTKRKRSSRRASTTPDKKKS